MKNAIPQIIKLLNENESLNIKELATQTDFSIKEITRSLDILESQFRIVEKDERYKLIDKNKLKIGTLKILKSGYGIALVGDKKLVKISPKNLHGAKYGDVVLIRVSDSENPLYGKVDRVFSKSELMVGEVIDDFGKQYIIPDNPHFPILVTVDQKLEEGLKVVFKLQGNVENNIYEGKIIRVLGHKDEYGIDSLAIIKDFGFRDEFNEEVQKELLDIKDYVTADEMENRLDLRNLNIFTIDGEDTKDIDDAVSIKQLENGGYLLGVHIADVSHYVKENSAIDLAALENGTSIYCVNKVVPMLPSKLSNGICSLNEKVDRLAVSIFILYDQNGKVLKTNLLKSVINSKKKMTYEAVNKVLNGKHLEEYSQFSNDLKAMEKLAMILNNLRKERGNISFSLDENEASLDQFGNIKEVHLKQRGMAEDIIEEFMIAANVEVANIMNDFPILYRVHDKPSTTRYEKVIDILNNSGCDIKKEKDYDLKKALPSLLAEIKDRQDHNVLESKILKVMKSACYSTDNIGHFGLASSDYTHFTSPIRRYPDLENHRMINEFYFNKEYNKEELVLKRQELMILGSYLSSKEQEAKTCERVVDKMKMAEYMQKYEGEVFDGHIGDITAKGLVIQLDNMIEGIVPYKNLERKFIFDSDTYTIHFINNNVFYKIGMPVKVVLVNSSKRNRTIEFKILQKTKTEEYYDRNY